MQISIVTPSYNYAWCIDDAIDSVRAQMREKSDLKVEHIIVDDASSDGTLERLWARRDEVEIVIARSDNRGLAVTLNEALSHATGEWTGWLNADDFYLPGAFDALLRYVGSRPHLDAVVADVAFVDHDGKLDRIRACYRPSRTVTRSYGPTIAPAAVFVRTSALKKYGFEPRTIRLMDWWLQLDLVMNHHPIGVLPRTTGVYRQHGAQASVQSDHRHDEETRLLVRTFGLRDSAWNVGSMTRRAGALVHGMSKAMTDGYAVEHRARERSGQDLRWWKSADARQSAEAIACLRNSGERAAGRPWSMVFNLTRAALETSRRVVEK